MSKRALTVLHTELDACTRCPEMIGPVVHGPPVMSKVLLVGQAPGPHEGKYGRPFAWTAGKTLFRWLAEATGADEETSRRAIYFAAVNRCFPGKAKGGGDRRPNPVEIANCRPFLEGEVRALRPSLVIPVGTLAIAEVLGHSGPLAEVVGEVRAARYHGHAVDVIALPHPSGASTWHKMELGRTLLARALAALGRHPALAAEIARCREAP